MSESVERLEAEYDAVPYESHAFPQTAPGHLAAVAYLFGLEPPNPSTARVLEIGCSAGGNLIPFALWNSRARAVGIDLSQVQINHGRQIVEALGARNVELIHGDIAKMDLAALGQFDYIVCHGVYSWVPENVQDAILSAFHELLTPDGVAYVSYNVYPGWKAKEIIRDAMLLRGGDRRTPAEKLSYARGMIDFLEQVAPPDSVLAKAVADFRAEGTHDRDYYVLHEQLEAVNAPCYFLDFGRRADPHRLSYLADASPQTMFALNYGQKVAEPLLKECGHSQVLVEQYLDFVVNRTFRQSLLVHAKSAPRISYRIDRTRFGRMHFAASMPPAAEPTRFDGSTQEYGQKGRAVFTADPAVKAALDALTERWPWTLSRYELLFAVHSRLSSAELEAAADLESRIDELLEALVVRGLARFRLDPVAPEGSGEPLQLPRAIRQLAGLAPEGAYGYTVNAWHEGVSLTPVERHLFPLLDGTRDRDTLIAALHELLGRDLIGFVRDGRTLVDAEELAEATAEYVDTLSQRLADMRLSTQR